MIKAFLFDLDGVIVDTAIYHYQAWRNMANNLGFDISEEFNEGLKGISRMESLDLILAHGNVSLPNERKEELAKQKNEIYLKLVSKMTPKAILPGISDFINETKQAQIKIGLGSVSKNARMILEQIGMVNDFDAIIDGTKINRSKPDPEVFLKGASELGISPAECVVFEDAVAGVEAAKAAGMKVVGIGKSEVLTEADVVIESFHNKHLKDILDIIS